MILNFHGLYSNLINLQKQYDQSRYYLDTMFLKLVTDDVAEIIKDSINNYTKSQINLSNCFKTKMIKKRKLIKENQRVDCIKKRIKSLCHKYIINKLNCLLSTTKSKFKLYKISRELSTNVKKDYNKEFLNNTLKNIILMNINIQKNTKTNKNLLALAELERLDVANKLIYMRMKDIYVEYFNSDAYQSDVNRLKRKENESYIIKYLKISKQFVEYYICD